jgi:hypothetical protein
MDYGSVGVLSLHWDGLDSISGTGLWVNKDQWLDGSDAKRQELKPDLLEALHFPPWN